MIQQKNSIINKITKITILVILFIFSIIVIIKFLKLIKFKCVFRTLFNIYCTGCGTTRMIESIFKLKFYQAFRYNPYMFIITLLFAIIGIYNTIRYLLNKPLYKPTWWQIAIIISIGFIFMILRNIKGLEFLLPTKL